MAGAWENTDTEQTISTTKTDSNNQLTEVMSCDTRSAETKSMSTKHKCFKQGEWQDDLAKVAWESRVFMVWSLTDWWAAAGDGKSESVYVTEDRGVTKQCCGQVDLLMWTVEAERNWESKNQDKTRTIAP